MTRNKCRYLRIEVKSNSDRAETITMSEQKVNDVDLIRERPQPCARRSSMPLAEPVRGDPPRRDDPAQQEVRLGLLAREVGRDAPTVVERAASRGEQDRRAPSASKPELRRRTPKDAFQSTVRATQQLYNGAPAKDRPAVGGRMKRAARLEFERLDTQKRFSGTEHRVFQRLLDQLMPWFGQVTDSVDNIALETGRNPRRVTAAISTFVNRGVLHWKQGGGRGSASSYALPGVLIPIPQDREEASAEAEQPDAETMMKTAEFDSETMSKVTEFGAETMTKTAYPYGRLITVKKEARFARSAHASDLDLEEADATKPKPKAPARKQGSARGTRLPADWTLPEDEQRWALDEFQVDDNAIKREVEKFRDYWIGVPGSKGVKLDWDATWRNWCRRAGWAYRTTPREQIEAAEQRRGPARPANNGRHPVMARDNGGSR